MSTDVFDIVPPQSREIARRTLAEVFGDRPPLLLTRLTGGVSAQTYRVDVPDGRWVLRLDAVGEAMRNPAARPCVHARGGGSGHRAAPAACGCRAWGRGHGVRGRTAPRGLPRWRSCHGVGVRLAVAPAAVTPGFPCDVAVPRSHRPDAAVRPQLEPLRPRAARSPRRGFREDPCGVSLGPGHTRAEPQRSESPQPAVRR